MFIIDSLAEIGNLIKEYLGWAMPGLLIILALIIAASLIRWYTRVIVDIKTIAERPTGVILFVIIVAIMLFAWFAIAARFFN